MVSFPEDGELLHFSMNMSSARSSRGWNNRERETEIGRDNEGEKNLEMRVEFAIRNVLK